MKTSPLRLHSFKFKPEYKMSDENYYEWEDFLESCQNPPLWDNKREKYYMDYPLLKEKM